ncbi:ATP-dependent RNA helicase HrpA [Thioalbus denitrificans]|uniref:RNA helicase n=1 Tax=Thioalbus denitrificans TaxID=547122 RepID=A0A369CI68_9GAMM|nr:ATP-dependent RNA helicase HrpA [Thioalbus denitrificans]RCX32147.1 ATP-dependent helicase HrpA [Thioalbus denitrificans]
MTLHHAVKILQAELHGCMLADRRRLRGRLRRLLERGEGMDKLAVLEAEVRASAARRERRRAALPVPEFPPELPVSAQRDVIADAIRDHQVVVIAGETGSGKTTQLPKICLELGRGVDGLIGHTQPRRIAARNVAQRIADELGTPLGQAVGYKVRFTDRGGGDTHIKLMTDGILLAETQGDRRLEQYDTLIIDEAHERSLNIDFLLGYIRQLLPRRPDLKVIITSATIDPQRFSRFFGGAPVLEVSGRTYPVEVRYRPLYSGEGADGDRDQLQGILDAVDEAARHGPGDTLVFLAGEREIRETAEALRKHHPPHTQILPLFARLSAAEQQRVFAPHGGRRIVLATNVAETSLTVPGIRYVVDPGTARISRYSVRSKVQGLLIEPISQASANQRKGRCGRISAGLCFRLYAEEDFLSRPEFTDPEILRTNLAAVILRMQALGLGDVERFPFLDAPDARAVNDGFRLLGELGALDGHRGLTPLGRQLARLPVDPRIGRMVLAGAERHCLEEVLIIASALSIQDPRERPLEAQQAADEAHKAFRHPESDFLGHVNLWRVYQEQKQHLSQNKLRRWCRDHFLSFLRMREWEDIHTQIFTLVREMGMRPNQVPAEYDAVHKALLSGLLDNVALRIDGGEGEGAEKSGRRRPPTQYQGARGTRLQIFPGSSLAARKPRWIVAAELVETQRVYARGVARVEPEWVEEVGAHLVRRNLFDPHWEKRPARVMAYERVSLYGLVLQPKRPVHYGPVAPDEAREIFIRAALVRGDYRTDAEFFAHNRALIEEVEGLESKSRRRDILVDEAVLYEFYDRQVPAGIHSGAQFEKWLRQAGRERPDLLHLSREYLMQHGAAGITEDSFPGTLEVEGLTLPLDYHFEPGHEADGVTVSVPAAALNQLRPEAFGWLVPGLLRDKVIALIKSLPKSLRRSFVPVPDFADACLERMEAGAGELTVALGTALAQMTGIRVPAEAWREAALPDHLRMRFRVLEGKRELASGRDLPALRDQLQGVARQSFRKASDRRFEREGIRSWDFGDLPEQVVLDSRGGLSGYPGLVDRGEAVDLRLFDTPQKAETASRHGLTRLFLLALGTDARRLAKGLPVSRAMCLHYTLAVRAEPPATVMLPADDPDLAPCEALRRDLLRAAAVEVFLGDAPLARDRQAFERRLEEGRRRLVETANRLAASTERALETYHGVAGRLAREPGPADAPAWADLREQLGALVYRGFAAVTPAESLRHLPRYLAAMERRLEKRALNPARDDQSMAEIRPLWEAWRRRAEVVAGEGRCDPALVAFRWALEELRVSLFAQELKTAQPVSLKRLRNRWAELECVD